MPTPFQPQVPKPRRCASAPPRLIELLSLSLLNVVAEMVNIPLATTERIASTAAKSPPAALSEEHSSSGERDREPDDRDVNQALPLLTRSALKYQGFAVSNLPLDKGDHFSAIGRPISLNEVTKRGFRLLFLASDKVLDRLD